MEEPVYESPELVKVGSFAEVTLGVPGLWSDMLTSMQV
ncbi:lasso RiPP family leader peptide-containing protein [Streptomyces netropsis]